MGISMSHWRSAYASVQGTSHIKANQPCQDSCRYERILTLEGKAFLVMIASDGAGSALFSDEGSQMTCQLFLERISRFFEKGRRLDQITERHTGLLIRYISAKIDRVARKRGVKKRDFAATLLIALVGDDDAAFLQLGDGAIVINSGNGYHPVFWPQSGEYANQTYFVTDASADQNLNFEFVNEKINEVAIFTDGIQGLALKYDIQAAYTPFFKPLFEYLKNIPEENTPQLNEQVETFLNSAAVNSRTEDDKTLMIACRLLRTITDSQDLSVIEN
jgi:hypothetical protein